MNKVTLVSFMGCLIFSSAFFQVTFFFGLCFIIGSRQYHLYLWQINCHQKYYFRVKISGKIFEEPQASLENVYLLIFAPYNIRRFD